MRTGEAIEDQEGDINKEGAAITTKTMGHTSAIITITTNRMMGAIKRDMKKKSKSMKISQRI
jgi:hypothetical protein